MKYFKDQVFIDKFGKRLKQLRELKGLSQEQLAYKTDISQSQIARTELGQLNTSISHVALYAKYLDVQPQDLFDFSLLDSKK